MDKKLKFLTGTCDFASMNKSYTNTHVKNNKNNSLRFYFNSTEASYLYDI